MTEIELVSDRMRLKDGEKRQKFVPKNLDCHEKRNRDMLHFQPYNWKGHY